MVDDNAFLAFYPGRIWVGEKPTWASMGSQTTPDPEVQEAAMKEIVFSETKATYDIRLCRDGMCLLWLRPITAQRASDAAERFTQLAYVNAAQLLLHSAVRTVQKHGLPTEHLTSYGVGTGTRSEGVPGSSAWRMYEARYQSTYKADRPLCYDDRLIGRHLVVSRGSFDAWIENLDKVIDDAERVRVLNQVAVAIGHFHRHNIPGSLASTWFVVEYFLDCFWTSLVEDNATWANSEERNLWRGRDYTAAVRASTLALSGKISPARYRSLTQVRRKRNDVVHDIAATPGSKKAVSIDDCSRAFDLLADMMRDRWGLTLRFVGGLSY